MTETLAHGWSSESIQQELPDEYQQERVYMVFKILCVLGLSMNEASALEGLIEICTKSLRKLSIEGGERFGSAMLSGRA